MKKLLAIYLLSIVLFACSETNQKGAAKQLNPPKLVIGIVVDQMRYDYLARYWNRFGDDGFKKLVSNGFSCNNMHYNYMPTYTAPGHASIYTGTTPSNHGIISNTWYDKVNKEMTYCTSDNDALGLGTKDKYGKMSPNKLIASTITDEFKNAFGDESKVIGLSIKDRGAILPAGHKADLALWFQGDTLGSWISSNYYGNELPTWVEDINKKGVTDKYLSGAWNTLYPIATYTASHPDSNIYERPPKTMTAAIFPYDLTELADSNGQKGIIRSTPFGNTILKDLAVAAIENENLGQDSISDFLAVSFSSTDYIGHQFGPNSIEIEDTYLRLDKELAEFIAFVEERIGKENVLIYLTADHGAVPVPQYLIESGQEGGYFDTESMEDELKSVLEKHFGSVKLIENISNFQVFLNHQEIEKLDLQKHEVCVVIEKYLSAKEGVSNAFCAANGHKKSMSEVPYLQVFNGYHKERSGDVLFVLKHGWIEEYGKSHQGTTHGSPYEYDTHVPMIWYGWNISAGKTENKTVIPDIAATISALLKISAPDHCTGKPIKEIVQ